jgi:hypothetical protein
MSKQLASSPTARAEMILAACDRFSRTQLLEKLLQEVKVIAPKLGQDGEKVVQLLKELDAA